MYARIKHEFCCEKYINSISENNNRNAITQFRLSSHDHVIEQGRYQHMNGNGSICYLC